MYKWILLTILLCGEVLAEKQPTLIGVIRNRAQGEITLTSETCRSDPTMNFVFVRERGGKLSLSGCWKMIEYNIIVKWADGDIYSYPVENIEFTPEFNQWYERDKMRNQRNPNVF